MLQWIDVDNLGHLRKLRPEVTRRVQKKATVKNGTYDGKQIQKRPRSDESIRIEYLAKRCVESEEDNHRLAQLVEEALVEREDLEKRLNEFQNENKELNEKLRSMERMRLATLEAIQKRKEEEIVARLQELKKKDTLGEPRKADLESTIQHFLKVSKTHILKPKTPEPFKVPSPTLKSEPIAKPFKAPSSTPNWPELFKPPSPTFKRLPTPKSITPTCDKASSPIHHPSPKQPSPSKPPSTLDDIDISGASPEALMGSSPPRSKIFSIPLSPIQDSEDEEVRPNVSSSYFTDTSVPSPQRRSGRSTYHMDGGSERSEQRSRRVMEAASEWSEQPSRKNIDRASEWSEQPSRKNIDGASEWSEQLSCTKIVGASEWSEPPRPRHQYAASDAQCSRNIDGTSEWSQLQHDRPSRTLDLALERSKSRHSSTRASHKDFVTKSRIPTLRTHLSPPPASISFAPITVSADPILFTDAFSDLWNPSSLRSTGSFLFENDTSMISTLPDILEGMGGGDEGFLASFKGREEMVSRGSVSFFEDGDVDQLIRTINAVGE